LWHCHTDTREITKSIRVTDCPLRITIELWLEEKRMTGWDRQPVTHPTWLIADAGTGSHDGFIC
jgi:hypothetical protein